MRKCFLLPSCGVAAMLVSSSGNGAETISFSYDALGRLVLSTTSGGPNSAIGSTTCFDAAGSRARQTVGSGVTSCGTPTPTPTPTPSNTPPVAVNDTSSGACNVEKIVNVVTNDYDPNGNTPLSLVSVNPAANTYAYVYSGTSLAVVGSGSRTEYIYYVVQDSLGAIATGRFTYTTTGTAQQCYQ